MLHYLDCFFIKFRYIFRFYTEFGTMIVTCSCIKIDIYDTLFYCFNKLFFVNVL